MYKSGTGTRGRGHRDACLGTWDLGRRDEVFEDIKYGTRGRVGRGRRTSNTGTRGRQIQGRKGTRVGILDPGGILFEYLKQERVSGERR